MIAPRSRPLTKGAIRFTLIISVALSACQTLHSLPFFNSKPAPVPTVQPSVAVVSPTATPTATPAAHAADTHKHRRRAKHGPQEAAAPSITPTPAGGEDKPPVLSLAPPADSAQEQATKQRAQNAMDDAAGKLATVDRSRLEGQRATDYDLATGFIKAAQDALREDDFAKAESLAEKGAVLAGLLANTGAAGR